MAAAVPDALGRCEYAGVADFVIVQMQDNLMSGNEEIMNVPASVGENWKWQLNTYTAKYDIGCKGILYKDN